MTKQNQAHIPADYLAMLAASNAAKQSPAQPAVQPQAQFQAQARPQAQNPSAMFQSIPDELKRDGRFFLWKYKPRPGKKPAKVPYNPVTGQEANVSDPGTACSFGEAMQHLTPEYNGIGILINGKVSAIDIDNCRDDNGQLSPMAAEIVREMNSYTEVSPSGHGIRIIFRTDPNFNFDKSLYYINNQAIGLEIYTPGTTARYVTLTGNTITPGLGIQERTQPMLRVLDKNMRRSAATPVPPVSSQPPVNSPQLTDGQIVQNIQNSRSGPAFQKLFDGDMSAYANDHSSADMALANILAAFTKDPNQIDRIFRTSKLMRPKWDTPRGQTTYGRMTIDKAIQSALQYALQNRAAAVAVQQPPTPPLSALISASALLQLNLPEVAAYVEDMLLEGTTTILAGTPKCGKSWLVTSLAISVATGAKFLGRNTVQAGVLYLALEDGHKRLQSRIKKLLAGAPAPDNLYLQNAAPTISTGLFGVLEDYLATHPDIKVIILDTLALVRSSDNGGTFSYSSDYADLGAFKRFGEAHRVTLVLVHHVRKSRDDSNPFNDISGTNGITGAVDTMLVLERKRNSPDATLHITGRDVTEVSLAIALDKETMRWESLGDIEIIREEREKQAFLDDPLVQTIYELTNESPTHTWSGQASDLVAAGTAHSRDLGTPQTVGYKLRDNAPNFQRYLGIEYSADSVNGTAGKSHSFKLCDSPRAVSASSTVPTNQSC